MHALPSAFRAGLRMARGGSFRGSLYGGHALRQQFAGICAQVRPDVVHVDRLRAYGIARDVAAAKIVDLTDPLGAATAWLAERASPLARPLLRREAAALWHDEAMVAANCPVLFASASGLETFLERVPLAQARWVPHPVARGAATWPERMAAGHDKGLNLAFAGNLDYWPNLRGLSWFMAAVLPVLRQRVPGVTLTLFGSSPTSALKRLAREASVSIVADAPDLFTDLRTANLLVAPNDFCGGFPNKITDALLRAQIPVLASPAVVRGLPARARPFIPMATTPSAWVAALSAHASDAGPIWRACRTAAEILKSELSTENCLDYLFLSYEMARVGRHQCTFAARN
jgi:glycosyltransferase involved in cell wall biosynthesis